MNLPKLLHPFSSNHPASTAYRLQLSPHEWDWTQEEQEHIAQAVIELDDARQKAMPLLLELYRHSKRSCHTEKLAAQVMRVLGLVGDGEKIPDSEPRHSPSDD